MVSIIACIDSNYGIGKNNDIPWKLKPDLKYFKQMTLNSVIIMGANTWRSIGSKPLPNRINLVISNTIPNSYKSVEDALTEAKKYDKPIFIIGGESIYEQSFKYAYTVYLTRINNDYECDTFFPKKCIENMNCTQTEWFEYNNIVYRYEIYSSV